ncbi:MAG TPA: T9SS type A sorting domain-containing protein, partial [Puia sp.]|nr:T9SS type A sorting domain-containing protein [Puia sp.]
AIIVKFSPTGTFQWSTYRGGGGDDHFRNCIADGQGNLYFAGYSLSPANVVTANAFQPVYGGNGDCMIAKYTPAGNVIWCTYYGAKGQDRLHAINLDLYGHLLVQGTTGSDSGVATAGAHQVIYGGGDEDVLLAEFDTAGHRIWCTYYGGEYSDRGRGVQSDSAGKIYIGGLTESSTGIATPDAHQLQWTEGYYDGGSRAEDGYLAKFSPDGHELIWGTYYGGSSYDRIWGITLDRKSHALYAVGGTASPNNISTTGAWQPAISIGPWGEGFFSRWDYDNNLVWGSYLGETSEDHLEDVELDSQEFLYLLGQTDKSLMPVTLGVQQTNSNGMDDAFLYKFYPGLTCYDYNEPNETFGTAKLITAWTPTDSLIYGYNGSIANKDDQDWFRLKVKASQPNIEVVLSDLVKDYNLKFYNGQKVLLQSSTNTGTTNDTIIANNLAAGTYYIRITHTNPTFDSLNCYRLITLKSSGIFMEPQNVNKFIETAGVPAELKVFPNPASENLSFSVSALASGSASLIVFDMVGRIVKTESLNLEEGFQTIELPVMNLPSGMYKMVLKSNEKSWVANFVKQ